MFVAGSRNVYNDVAVQLRDGGRNGGHVSLRRGRGMPGELAEEGQVRMEEKITNAPAQKINTIQARSN